MTSLLTKLEPCDVEPDDPQLEEMIRDTRAKYHLEPRNRMLERAQKWYGMRDGDRLVAAVGESRSHYGLEVTDCYQDNSREGTTAVYAMLLGYYEMLQRGEIDTLVHTCLFENVEMWEAVRKVTGDNPAALLFVHKRKG